MSADRDEDTNAVRPAGEHKPAGEDTPAGEAAPAETESVRTGWSRLWRAARPRATKANALITVLALGLGVAMVAQVRETRSSGLENLRQDDLVALLDGVNQQSIKLGQEADRLTTTRDRLRSGGGDQAALQAATDRLQTLGILAGTLPATGPGIRMTIEDPGKAVKSSDILNAVEELRDAGAEAIQLNDVRIVADSWFGTGADGRMVADGKSLTPPYVLTAIGDSHTMATAMAIPGGVVDAMKQLGATPTVTSVQTASVTALRAESTPRYAQPSSP